MEPKPVSRWRWVIGGLLVTAVAALFGARLWHGPSPKPHSTTLTTVETAEFSVSVDYATPIAMLVKQGAYEDVNTLNALDFKTDALAQYRETTNPGKETVTLTLIRFRDPSQRWHTTLSKAKVHKALDELGLRSANLREFLEFGRQHPEELSKRRSITALGTRFESIYEGKIHGLGHICMNGSADGEMAFDDGNRSLFILWGSPDENQENISDGWWFAAVPK